MPSSTFVLINVVFASYGLFWAQIKLENILHRYIKKVHGRHISNAWNKYKKQESTFIISIFMRPIHKKSCLSHFVKLNVIVTNRGRNCILMVGLKWLLSFLPCMGGVLLRSCTLFLPLTLLSSVPMGSLADLESASPLANLRGPLVLDAAVSAALWLLHW